MNKEKKIVLVTGTSRGIGHGIAKLLAADDEYIVVGTATSESGAEQITNTFTQQHGKAKGKGIVLDLKCPDKISNALQAIHLEFGKIDILVNNAGVTHDSLLMRMSDDDWKNVIDVNLNSVFHLTKAVIPSMMKKKFGRVINIGSVVGVMGNAGQTNYAAAKAGLIGFSKSLAREVGSRNITVNVIAPGFIETDMTRKLTEEQRNKILTQIPCQRFGEVNDIAHAVAFLASKEAGYITGQTIHINGGMGMI